MPLGGASQFPQDESLQRVNHFPRFVVAITNYSPHQSPKTLTPHWVHNMPLPQPRIYESTFAPAVIPHDESFWQFMLRRNVDDTTPDTVTLQEHERPDKFFTYGSAPRLAGLGADGLKSVLGLQRGDTVLIVGTNTLDYLHVEFSALWGGIVAA